jgi:hypothetical protein
MEVPSNDQMVRLQGDVTCPQAQVAAMTVEEVEKSFKGNDMWAPDVVDFAELPSDNVTVIGSSSVPDGLPL